MLDESILGKLGTAAIGDVLRDYDGSFKRVFSKPIRVENLIILNSWLLRRVFFFLFFYLGSLTWHYN